MRGSSHFHVGRSLPSWMITPGTVLLKFVRNKSDPLCEDVDLLDADLKSALIRFQDGRETTVQPPLVAVSTVLLRLRVLTIQLPMLNRQCP